MSGIDVFSKDQFEGALGAAVRKIVDSGTGARLGSLGVIKGEYVYSVMVTGTNKRIVVRSSVKVGQVSAGLGEDSIRMWIEYHYKGRWVALKGETRTHRTPGWEGRMGEKLTTLFETALADSRGRGQRTAKPEDKLAALGLDVSTQADEPKEESPEPVSPKCPKCGAEMKLRTARRGPNAGNQFWGCSRYPKCRGTVDAKKVSEVKESEPVEVKEFTPSSYQAAVKDFLLNESGNAVVIAVPGSGKTTTLVWLLGFTDKGLDVAFVAFNRLIARELAKRAPQHVHVSTLHSLGFGNIRDALGRVKVEPNKVRNIVRDMAEGMSRREYEMVRMNEAAILRLVSLCKATLSQPTGESLEYLSDRFGIETNGAKDLVFDLARKAFTKSRTQTHVIDYDDMIYFPAAGMVGCEKFDLLFVDECQDLNKAQIALALNSIKENGRIIAVGDPKQSIYGFRGADTEAIPNLIEATSAVTLPLSITYRCPKSHVEFIKHLIPDIEAAEWAEEGIIESISGRRMMEQARDGDLVLCRTNAPLVGPAFSLIREGKKAVILGRDIGKGLLVLVRKVAKKYGVHQLADTLFYLTEYAEKELGKLYAQKKINRAQILEDKVLTIAALAEGCDTMRELEDRVDEVFSDDAQGVTFSSVHKAKGGEAERVYILHKELMPHPRCSSDWGLEQEKNIMTVAFSRSKKEMYFVS